MLRCDRKKEAIPGSKVNPFPVSNDLPSLKDVSYNVIESKSRDIN